MAPVRRSTRVSGNRAIYTNDVFKVAGVSDESASEEETSTAQEKGKEAVQDEADLSDDDFVNDSAGDYEEVGEEEEGGEDEDEDGDEGEGDESEISEEADEEKPKNPSRIKKVKAKRATKASNSRILEGVETRSRGIWVPSEHFGKFLQLKLHIGTDERDLLAIVYARDRWCQGIDSTLPTRKTLDEAQTVPDYRYGQSFGVQPEEMEKERTRGWDWYYDADVGGRFRNKQRVEEIQDENTRRTYMPSPKKQKHTIIIGPAGKQKVFELGQNEFVNFGDAWENMKPRNKNSSKNDTAGGPAGGNRKIREGWIFNMGNKIQCLAWAPNQAGLTQYLAAVAPITDEQKSHYSGATEPKAAPAFTPSPPYACALQIWAFKASRDGALTKTLDAGFAPRLRLALCTDWGDLRRISWCPMARDARDEDEEDALKNIGLLAGVWGDGRVRVLDIKLSRSSNTTEFCESPTGSINHLLLTHPTDKVHSPVFEAKPPSTVCTSVTWLSPSDIAVGCANGFVAVWNILPSQTTPLNPTPYFYQQIHMSYILNVGSAYPTNPHLLCTTSMDGGTYLTSLLDPQKDMTGPNHMRIALPHISYSPLCQAFMTSDENESVRLLSVRRFFATTAVAKPHSTVSAMAPCSVWHPSVLVGCTDGTVIASNVLRRLISSKDKRLQQTWFMHEWVRGREAGSPGVSRFQDGFPAGLATLQRSERTFANGVAMLTIFEENNHITAVAWNPNQSCAGWASAGMGCGLVRVEDLAL